MEIREEGTITFLSTGIPPQPGVCTAVGGYVAYTRSGHGGCGIPPADKRLRWKEYLETSRVRATAE